ncbi:hypothetical protein A2773_04930 [Candidatus Gottesmanbacteria bacterium RIFCSPHIGHO2_01_FULL_39_10]|uniref:Methyltransferase type 11 domain-containing protein n=1 Tax=Candidatus Gottesmanbacteria bacterium RIFCSPHIGHO2_01_FULL_39_10 TaxID=1798375 RepID=A0A1F5ZRW5_9BACT|nr:MAG: hypothetical protein A2773_04930 [Candidatus Gottesmanbacteria bacterium RIFCSPHIGHO2_01_FULL_39_10]
MKIMKCAICGDKQKIELLYKESVDFEKVDKNTFSARRIPEKVHYQLQRCNNCGLIISSPILSPDKIKHLYKESEFTYTEEVPSLRKTYGWYLGQTLKHTGENPKLLEIGAGNGFFLEEVKKMGIKDFWGVEPSKQAIQKAKPGIREKMIAGFFPHPRIMANSFDVICVFQTLDHIITPNTFLKECHTALKKGGVILTILHDTSGLSVKILGERSPIFDIEHIYLFNKENLARIFEKNKFKVLSVFDVKNSYPLRYWLRMFPLPNTVKKVIYELVRLVKLDKLEVAHQAGNIGIIAQKS